MFSYTALLDPHEPIPPNTQYEFEGYFKIRNFKIKIGVLKGCFQKNSDNTFNVFCFDVLEIIDENNTIFNRIFGKSYSFVSYPENNKILKVRHRYSNTPIDCVYKII
jgi:hypothetical protein